MTYHCKLCDSDFTSQSYGGPDICPACDCGIDPKVIKLQNENAQLHAEIARLRECVTQSVKTVQKMVCALQSTQLFRQRAAPQATPIGFIQPEDMAKIESLHHTSIYSVDVRVDTVSGHDGIAIYAAPQAMKEQTP